MVLIEPIFLPEQFYEMTPSLEAHPLASKSIKRLNHWNSEEEAMSYLKSRSFFSSWDPEIMHLYKQFGMEKMTQGDMRLTCTPESEAPCSWAAGAAIPGRFWRRSPAPCW
jgi:hypothetical protein